MASSDFGITLAELRQLMEHRGNEALEKVGLKRRK